MKCPRCGSNNIDTAVTCYRCGMEFTPSSKLSSAVRVWSGAEQHKADTEKAVDTEKVTAAADQAAQSDESLKSDTPKKPRIKVGRFFLVLSLLLIVLAGAAFGITRLARLIVNVDKIPGSSDAASDVDPNTVDIERFMVENEVWHRLTFHAKDGERILVTSPTKASLAIHDGVACIELADGEYIPDTPEQDRESISIQVEATLIHEDGSEESLNVPVYDLEIPFSPLKVLSPAEQGITTDESRMVVKLKVLAGSRVFINDSNVTDLVDRSGFVSVSVSLEAIGTNTIRVEVETPKYRTNTYEILVDRPTLDVPINIPNSQIPEKTEADTLTISGSAEPGAIITTDAPLSGELITDLATGEFSMEIKLGRYEWNTFNIKATASDGRTSSITYRVYREANLNNYTRKAWIMDYDYVSVAPDALISQEFLMYATVQSKYDTEEGSYYLVNVSTKGELELLVMEYTGNSVLEVGKTYKVFADVTGTYVGYPLLTARFLYDYNP